MKLSLRWIFDHINADYKKLDITQLVDKFNKITAEIEGYEKFEINLSDFFLVTVKETSATGVLAFCKELGKDINLPARTNALVDCVYVIKKDPSLNSGRTGQRAFQSFITSSLCLITKFSITSLYKKGRI